MFLFGFLQSLYMIVHTKQLVIDGPARARASHHMCDEPSSAPWTQRDHEQQPATFVL